MILFWPKIHMITFTKLVCINRHVYTVYVLYMCRCISPHAAVTLCRGSLNCYCESQFGHGRLQEKANISQHSYTYLDLSTGEWVWMQRLASHLQTSLSDGRRRRETWERERERYSVMWRLKCRLWRDKDGERERAAEQTKPKRESIKRTMISSLHRTAYVSCFFFFFHHSHPHAALDLLFCCDDGKRDNKKGWITHTHTHKKENSFYRTEQVTTPATGDVRDMLDESTTTSRHRKPQLQQHVSACVSVSF